MQTNTLTLEELAGKVGGDAGGALGVLLAYIGDQSGSTVRWRTRAHQL